MLKLKVGDVLYSKFALMNEKIEAITVVKITQDDYYARDCYHLSNYEIIHDLYHNYVKALDFNLDKFFMTLKEFKENILPYLKKKEEKFSTPNDFSLDAIHHCLTVFRQFDIHYQDIEFNSSIFNDIKEISKLSGSWKMSSLSC